MATSGLPSGSFLPTLPPRLGEMLVARGLITAEQLGAALADQRPGERLGETLQRLGIAFEYDLARAIASQCGLKYIDLNAAGVDAACTRMLPEELVRALDVVPVARTTGGTVVVAAADPHGLDVGELERLLGAPVEVKVAELSVIRRLVEASWPSGRAPGPTRDEEPHATPAHVVEVAVPERSGEVCDYLRRLGAEARVQRPGVVVVAGGSLRYASEAGERTDVAEYLGSWTVVNGVEARLR